MGTGFVVASTPTTSYILTAAHVLGCDQYGDNCVDSLNVWFPGDAKKSWSATRAYSQTALSNGDYALVIVNHGNSPAYELANASLGASVNMFGYPKTLIDDVAAGKKALRPRMLAGTVRETLLDQRLLLGFSSADGDSGAPVFDTRGRVVGVLQGEQDPAHDIAVASSNFAGLVQYIREHLYQKPDALRASLLLRNALDWENIRHLEWGIGTDALIQRAEDQDFADSIALGNADSASKF